MDKFVDCKDVPLGDKIGWNVEYEPVWAGEGKVIGWKPKVGIYARGGRANVVFAGLESNYELKIDNAFDCLKPVEKRGLYDLYIDNCIDIPESISKDSPCYKQFMKEKEMDK